jgi:hypothetical protein
MLATILFDCAILDFWEVCSHDWSAVLILIVYAVGERIVFDFPNTIVTSKFSYFFCTNLNPIFSSIHFQFQFNSLELDWIQRNVFFNASKFQLKELRVLGFKVVFQGMKIIMVTKDGEKGMTLVHELKLMNA